MASAPTSNAEYLKLQETQDNTGEQIRLVPTLITEYQCMIIGSYGDQYASQIKDRVVPKESSKPGGKFLRGVTDDLEIVQEMIMNDSRKHLAYVLPDVPGAQRTCSHYISKIEVFLKTCQKSGAMPTPVRHYSGFKVCFYSHLYTSLIWYTGHGEKMTGNWCFKDGVISMEEIFRLYQQHFKGRLLTIVSDCCYSGQWVCRLAERLNDLKIGACGHQASKAGLALKIFTACQHNETAFDTIYAKKCVNLEQTNSSMVFKFHAVEMKHHGRSQTPTAIDTTQITCFSEQACRIDRIPRTVLWSWKDLIKGNNRHKRLRLRLFKVWGRKEQLPYWHFVIIFDDKFEEFCQLVKSGTPYDLGLYGHTVFSGYGKVAPPETERLFCQYGPAAIILPKDEPSIPGSHVHLQVRS